jgi:putative DNA primase/helicase
VTGALAALGILIRPAGPAEQRVPCPRCERGNRDDALGVNIETGTYHCFRCGWSGRADSGATRAACPVVRLDDPERAERVRKRLHQTWSSSKALSDAVAGPVRTYLEARGLAKVLARAPARLRAHPGLSYYDAVTQREVGRFPAMVACLTGPDDQPRTLHVTYLLADGRAKAPVPSPKKILGVPVRGATRGGSIRLYAPKDGRLGVAEGIENALSLAVIRGISTWSAFCADNLAALRLPRELLELQIGVDIDANGKGEVAARTLAERALRDNPSLRVRLIFPDGEAVPRDLNDELVKAVGAGLSAAR